VLWFGVKRPGRVRVYPLLRKTMSLLVRKSAAGLLIRELRASDLEHGFLETLSNLAPVGLSLADAAEVFRERGGKGIHTYVAVLGDQVVGTATLLLERKFVRGGARAGRVEDVAVREGHEGKGIGQALMVHVRRQAADFGCYKVTLSCYEPLVPFYEGAGFFRHDVGMRLNLTA
jgi:glucosamine-phosphate N-acetyltransferase